MQRRCPFLITGLYIVTRMQARSVDTPVFTPTGLRFRHPGYVTEEVVYEKPYQGASDRVILAKGAMQHPIEVGITRFPLPRA